jgi:mitochondrial fission protein ELM1
VTVRLIAVDPWDCGCTECITGEYVALRFATDENIADLLAGRLANHLNDGTELVVTTTYRTDSTGRRTMMRVERITVTYTHHDGETKTWEPDPYRASLAA